MYRNRGRCTPLAYIGVVSTPRRAGRPRSEASRRAILEATAALIAEVGYDALTIEAIAQRAGVGRQTIYRWWPSKASVVAETATGGVLNDFDPASLPADADLTTTVDAIVRATTAPERHSLIRGLAAAAAGDAADSDALYEYATRGSHSSLAGAIRRAQASGEAHAHLNPEASADAIIGALLYRVLTRQPIPEDYTESLLATLRP